MPVPFGCRLEPRKRLLLLFAIGVVDQRLHALAARRFPVGQVVEETQQDGAEGEDFGEQRFFGRRRPRPAGGFEQNLAAALPDGQPARGGTRLQARVLLFGDLRPDRFVVRLARPSEAAPAMRPPRSGDDPITPFQRLPIGTRSATLQHPLRGDVSPYQPMPQASFFSTFGYRTVTC
jgi:hypothetical protein